MNTIDSKVLMATNNLTLAKSGNMPKSRELNIKQQTLTPSGAEVAKRIEKTMAENKADIRELQRISKIVVGNKLQFNLNKELGTVIISVIDAETEQVIRQIPSEDMQKLKLRIRQAIGTLFDEIV